MNDVEPDDPVPQITDHNGNMVKSKTSKAVCTALSADVPPSIVEPPIVDPIVFLVMRVPEMMMAMLWKRW